MLPDTAIKPVGPNGGPLWTLEEWLSQYFCKYGWGDGDDTPAAAWDMRPSVCKVLNDHLPEGYKASESCWSSMHNDCCIVVEAPEGDIDTSDFDSWSPSSLDGDYKVLYDAIQAASADFGVSEVPQSYA